MLAVFAAVWGAVAGVAVMEYRRRGSTELSLPWLGGFAFLLLVAGIFVGYILPKGSSAEPVAVTPAAATPLVSEATPVEPSPPQGSSPVAGANLTVHVVSLTKESLASGATVRVALESDDSLIQSVQTDASGTARFSGLPVSRPLLVSAVLNGAYGSAPEEGLSQGDNEDVTVMLQSPGQQTPDINGPKGDSAPKGSDLPPLPGDLDKD